MMKTLVAWLVIVSIFTYSYFASFAYFSDSSSIRISLQMEPALVQISYENITLIHCYSRYYLLSGIVVNTTGNVTLEGIYFRSDGWTLKAIIIDGSRIQSENATYSSLDVILTRGSHTISLILYRTRSCENRGAMYIVFYIDGKEYFLSMVPGRCTQ